jgi:hypothetical protein
VIPASHRITAGVVRLAAEALLDLLLLPLRVVASLLFARRWRERTRRMILSESLHAPQDAHPPR